MGCGRSASDGACQKFGGRSAWVAKLNEASDYWLQLRLVSQGPGIEPHTGLHALGMGSAWGSLSLALCLSHSLSS